MIGSKLLQKSLPVLWKVGLQQRFGNPSRLAKPLSESVFRTPTPKERRDRESVRRPTRIAMNGEFRENLLFNTLADDAPQIVGLTHP